MTDNTNSSEPRGLARLKDPSLTKGTAFTEEERDRWGLRGLLPPKSLTMAHQIDRVMENLRRKESNLEKYILLVALQNRNERLFYRTLIDHVEEIMPLVYTPTVGEACLRYAHIFREPRGLYVTAEDAGRVASILENWPEKNVEVIVVTDGQRILGLGDLGANGMGIPVGKLALYTGCAGISPGRCLPVVLDVGTNNQSLLEDPLYLGLHQERITGDAYDALVEEFMDAAARRFPRAVIQFEDFESGNAFRFLDTYRDRYRCFNDDIQGTAGVTLAGLICSARALNRPFHDLKILFAGAGSAALGTGNLAMLELQEAGLSSDEAVAQIAFTDSKGLITTSRENIPEPRRRFAKDLPGGGLQEAIEQFEPDILVGATGSPGIFSKEVVGAMAKIKAVPIIFALSNPTSRAECTAEQAYAWSEGRAIFASGSPFPPVEINGMVRRPAQGNNVYIFPGVGLGALAVEAEHISESMFLAAARKLAEQVDDNDLASGALYPRLTHIRSVSLEIAVAVAERAIEDGLARADTADDLRASISEMMYDPGY